jgi:hypothetical protein
MKNGENYIREERSSNRLPLLCFIFRFWMLVKKKSNYLLIRLSGTNHISTSLRVQNSETKSRNFHSYLIGGGISGLSAARQLTKKRNDHFDVN